MTPAKLSCPKCRRTVPEAYWQGVDVVRCPFCEGHFEQIRFPALGAATQVDRAAVLGTDEANCYFHAQNRAEIACDGCGRYICAVCNVSFAGRHFCPSCLEARADRRNLPENNRVLYEHIAVVLAVLPMLIWPFTLLTAPAAIGVCIYGWRKPGSLLPRRRKLRFIIAGTMASLQIAAWIYFLGRILLK
jgi:hypothetical protein